MTPADEQAAEAYAESICQGKIPCSFTYAKADFLAGIAWERERAERDVGQVLDIAYGRPDPHPDHCLCDDCERARHLASKRRKK